MSKKKPPKDRLRPADVSLWQRMTRDVDRRDGADYVAFDVEAEVENVPDMPLLPEVRPVLARAGAPDFVEKGPGGVDGHVEARLRKGQIRPEATLDLHGMGQIEAYGALVDFVQGAVARGLRCILVITGKGRGGLLSGDIDWFAPKRGVLKQRVPEWLSERKMQGYVARFMEATPKDGGGGALYVYLRKNQSLRGK